MAISDLCPFSWLGVVGWYVLAFPGHTQMLFEHSNGHSNQLIIGNKYSCSYLTNLLTCVLINYGKLHTFCKADFPCKRGFY